PRLGQAERQRVSPGEAVRLSRLVLRDHARRSGQRGGGENRRRDRHGKREGPTDDAEDVHRALIAPPLRRGYVSTFRTPLPWTFAGDEKSCSSAACTSVARETPVPLRQSAFTAGSLSWSPWNEVWPVHWFVSTTSFTCVAVVSGSCQPRSVMFCPSGRGFT